MDDSETRQADAEEKEQDQGQEQDQNGADGGSESGSGEDDDPQAKAQQVEEETEAAKEKVKELEEDPPEKLEDWPDDKAKYETFGGAEGEHSYEDGPEKQLGPSSLRHHEGGGVSIEGDEVDDPDQYKSDPIPGGPTDPDAPRMYGDRDLSEDGGDEDGDDSDSESDSESKSESDDDD
jgi:hypothetical protein